MLPAAPTTTARIRDQLAIAFASDWQAGALVFAATILAVLVG